MLTAIIIVFILGYIAIVCEHSIKINKTASALVTGVLCWSIYALNGSDIDFIKSELIHHFADASEILFFLLGAMTIVELIDAHEGFDVIVNVIKTKKKSTFIWVIGFLSFFLSAILDNLTTTIVMVSFIRKFMAGRDDRLFVASIIVIAANAGGAWTPIGDVTTTMLWMGGQVTTLALMKNLFLPSLVCLVVPLLYVSSKMKGTFEAPTKEENDPLMLAASSRQGVTVSASKFPVSEQHKRIVFFLGITSLIFVPIFKTLTNLPPFMGMLLSLGIMWMVVEILHSEKDDEDKSVLTPLGALRKIDTPSILFFAGILLAVGTLTSTGILKSAAEGLTHIFGNYNIIAIVIGLLSAIVDNVPLVAASKSMYSLKQFPQDHAFWHLLAYCAGTGGSILIIGSAAGIAAMGMERIDFFWYMRRIAFIAALGYFAGCLVFITQHFIF